MNLFTIDTLRCSYDRHFQEGKSKVVLEIHHLELPRGKKVFIVGESGIGKSTILETLGMMNNTIVPDQKTRFSFADADGKEIDLKTLWNDSDRQLSEFRKRHFSFIFQSTNLMRNFTAFENIAFTRMLQGYSEYSCFQRTRQVLSDLGLERVDEARMAQELSGGQQQRLAFARAILPDFTVLFGDEPTGNLDPENAIRVMTILAKKLDEQKEVSGEAASAVIVSHDMHLAITFADIIIKIRKAIRPKLHDNDEDVMYGIIDDTCVYVPSDDRAHWSSVANVFDSTAFERFLREK